MPTYLYRCEDHGDFEQWRSIHESGSVICPDCQAPVDQILTPPLLSVYATPNKGMEARRIDRTEQQWDRDRPAYKRLRHEGHQPPHVDGAADLESRATNEFDVATGLKYGNLPEERVKEGIEVARDSGWIPSHA